MYMYDIDVFIYPRQFSLFISPPFRWFQQGTEKPDWFYFDRLAPQGINGRRGLSYVLLYMILNAKPGEIAYFSFSIGMKNLNYCGFKNDSKKTSK